jgi:hypothetical protein
MMERIGCGAREKLRDDVDRAREAYESARQRFHSLSVIGDGTFRECKAVMSEAGTYLRVAEDVLVNHVNRHGCRA